MRRILQSSLYRAFWVGIFLVSLVTSPTFAFSQKGGILCQGEACHQTDPYATGCASYAILLHHAPLLGRDEWFSLSRGVLSEKDPTIMGVVLLWQSLACQTYFAVAMSDNFSCHIFAEIWHWDGKVLGRSTDLSGSAPLSRSGNLEYAYTPQVYLSSPVRLWAKGEGELCTGTFYVGDTLSKEPVIL